MFLDPAIASIRVKIFAGIHCDIQRLYNFRGHEDVRLADVEAVLLALKYGGREGRKAEYGGSNNKNENRDKKGEKTDFPALQPPLEMDQPRGRYKAFFGLGLFDFGLTIHRIIFFI